MKNCLILGSGRSGTSMLAGILHRAGYYMGDKLHKPELSNPKGFFEWMTINQINELILAAYGKREIAGKLLETFLKKGMAYNPGGNQKWHSHASNYLATYKSQKQLIECCARSLDGLPYNGIDRACDSEIPYRLQALLDVKTNTNATLLT